MSFKKWFVDTFSDELSEEVNTQLMIDVKIAWDHQQKIIDNQNALLKEACELIANECNRDESPDCDEYEDFLNKPEIIKLMGKIDE